jgi:hypothetical protein
MERGTKLVIAGAAALLLTIAHHFYGAWLYATPWRHHVAIFAVPALFLLVTLHAIHRRHMFTRVGLAAGYTFAVITALVPVGLIGLFEGGYSHLLKNVVYFGGVRGASFDWWFPAPTYEIPNDLLFESSGVLQFVIGCYAAVTLAAFWRQLRHRQDAVRPLASV